VPRAVAAAPIAARTGPHARIPAMDIERINQIGTLLADLTARTEQLRGYL
jgi:hypothetical protein